MLSITFEKILKYYSMYKRSCIFRMPIQRNQKVWVYLITRFS